MSCFCCCFRRRNLRAASKLLTRRLRAGDQLSALYTRTGYQSNHRCSHRQGTRQITVPSHEKGMGRSPRRQPPENQARALGQRFFSELPMARLFKSRPFCDCSHTHWFKPTLHPAHTHPQRLQTHAHAHALTTTHPHTQARPLAPTHPHPLPHLHPLPHTNPHPLRHTHTSTLSRPLAHTLD